MISFIKKDFVAFSLGKSHKGLCSTRFKFKSRPHYAGEITWKNWGYTLKTHHMFSVYTTQKKFENASTTGHFESLFEESWARQITWLSWRHRCGKDPFSKCLQFTRKHKAGVIKFLRFEERFREAPFTVWISVDGSWPNRRNEAVFSNSSGVVWAWP